MKVIFLDHDGVICLETEWGSRLKKQKNWEGRTEFMHFNEIPIQYRFDNFNKKAVAVLNEILDTTNAEIVVSSDWRFHANLEELGEFYKLQGIIKTPIAVTPPFKACNWFDPKTFPWNKTDDLEQERTIEITQFLIDHPEIELWVAIDDLHMGIEVKDSSNEIHHRDWGLQNFVWTPNSLEGIKKSGTKEKIIKFLNMGN